MVCARYGVPSGPQLNSIIVRFGASQDLVVNLEGVGNEVTIREWKSDVEIAHADAFEETVVIVGFGKPIPGSDLVDKLGLDLKVVDALRNCRLVTAECTADEGDRAGRLWTRRNRAGRPGKEAEPTETKTSSPGLQAGEAEQDAKMHGSDGDVLVTAARGSALRDGGDEFEIKLCITARECGAEIFAHGMGPASRCWQQGWPARWSAGSSVHRLFPRQSPPEDEAPPLGTEIGSRAAAREDRNDGACDSTGVGFRPSSLSGGVSGNVPIEDEDKTAVSSSNAVLPDGSMDAGESDELPPPRRCWRPGGAPSVAKDLRGGHVQSREQLRRDDMRHTPPVASDQPHRNDSGSGSDSRGQPRTGSWAHDGEGRKSSAHRRLQPHAVARWQPEQPRHQRESESGSEDYSGRHSRGGRSAGWHADGSTDQSDRAWLGARGWTSHDQSTCSRERNIWSTRNRGDWETRM